MESFLHSVDHLCPNSHPLELSASEREKCFTSLPVRINNNFAASYDMQKAVIQDWRRLMDPSLPENYETTKAGNLGSWDAMAFPEAKPERLVMSVILSEVAILCDDVSESMSCDEAHNGFNTKTSEVLERAMNRDLNTPPRSTLEELFLPYLKRFLAIDHDRGVQVLKKWQEWFQKKDMKSELTFATLDEYLENRCMDMGILPYLAGIRYLMELDITLEELEKLEPIEHQVILAQLFLNDYWSWPKEKGTVIMGNITPERLKNAVAHMIRLDGMEEQKALQRVKELAIEHEKQLVQMCVAFLSPENGPPPSVHVQLYVHALLKMQSGTMYFYSIAARYQRWWDGYSAMN